MKTPMKIFKKHGAHYYGDDEDDIIAAMEEYSEQQVKNLNISDVIVRFLEEKGIDMDMDVKDITVGIEHAGHLKQDRLYIFDKDGNRLDSLDINDPTYLV